MTPAPCAFTLLDGGTGQELIRRSATAPSKIWSAQVLMTEPDLVASVHADFIAAGADIVTLNAYAVTPQRLARVGAAHLFAPLQQAAADAAQAARAGSNRAAAVRLAGCLPPLVASYRPDVAPDPAASRDTFRRIAQAQAAAVDLFLCETMAAVSEITDAATAAAETGKPVWVAMTVHDSAAGDGLRLRSGEPVADGAAAALDAGAQAVLINCARPEATTVAVVALAEALERRGSAATPFGAYANGFESIAALQPGGVVDALTARADLTVAAYRDHALRWLELGATLVGGCCEVGPAHIAALHRVRAAA